MRRASKLCRRRSKVPKIVRTDGRQAYITYPDGVGQSKLTMTIIEKKLGTRGTGRNWNTVLKLHALANRSSPECIASEGGEYDSCLTCSGGAS